MEAEIHLLIAAGTREEMVLAALRQEGISDTAIRPIEPSLKDVFVTLTRRLAKK